MKPLIGKSGQDESPEAEKQESDSATKSKRFIPDALAESVSGVSDPMFSGAGSIQKSDELKSSIGSDKAKWERDVFRDVLSNVNQTLRFQISLAVPLLAACVTMLNIVPPQAHQELLNDFDKWVFIPALLSIGIGYLGLEKHPHTYKKSTESIDNVEDLYRIIRYKNNTVRTVISLQALALVLMMSFVLLEYK
jgi:hypothetical protein